MTFNRIYEVKVTFRTVGLQTPYRPNETIAAFSLGRNSKTPKCYFLSKF